MSVVTDIKDALNEAFPGMVVPWGHVPSGKFLIVRPGGIQDGRSLVEVWIVNEAMKVMADPDEGLQELADEVYDVLRTNLVEPNVVTAPPYAPIAKSPHSALVLAGASPGRRGLRVVA